MLIKLRNYFIITTVIWAWYFPFVTALLFIMGITYSQWLEWIWKGFALDLIIAYPLGRWFIPFVNKRLGVS